MTGRLLTTDDVAEMLAVGTDWVREHAGELGGIRLGDPRRGPLRFRSADVNDYLERHRVAEPRVATVRRLPARTAPGVKLLPIPGGRA